MRINRFFVVAAIAFVSISSMAMAENSSTTDKSSPYQAKIILASAKLDNQDLAKVDDQIMTIEKNIIDYTNSERVKRGLKPLEIDSSLVNTSRKHAQWMASRRSLQHGRYGVGENIAMGQRSSREAVNDWMNSSGHRANILNSSYKRIGAAAYTTEGGTIYWCQQFSF
jgi:uncharacterized protein YkwD